MKQIVRALNVIEYTATTIMIALIFYKGLTLINLTTEISVVVPIMDITFILSTLLNLIYFKKHKVIFGFSIFSLILIVAAIVAKIMRIPYPYFALLFWDFYLMIYYGVLVIKQSWKQGGESKWNSV